MRPATRRREGADVRDAAYLVRGDQIEELVEGPVRVADGVQRERRYSPPLRWFGGPLKNPAPCVESLSTNGSPPRCLTHHVADPQVREPAVERRRVK